MLGEIKPFQITETAKKYLNDYMKETDVDISLQVKGGGCSGFTTIFNDNIQPQDHDNILLETETARVFFVDPKSVQMLKGMELDFIDSFSQKQLVLRSMSTDKNMCGCGKSFT